ncbi:MAG: dephospho-CoA kinase [Gammaproteobacteria bacterium]|nr:dephospho-CoA kinase [Gammaproteobacteria bacterium]MXX29126.1 dephospho-CoA kinase [Gammaproteobacteria bacterium]MYE52995.1 dephospho-CoA kinase [Gammaproteobacteria bacterium]MYH17429.1 dephospho-CoA kinase [Gammaproteobacteria bacterium]MYK83365.1 dephospho-CoA kinase [Gammaproteobacteria bacterium]
MGRPCHRSPYLHAVLVAKLPFSHRHGVALFSIGLTGGIASGKSTAARYLGELGAHVIDADRLGHRAYEPDTAAFKQVVDVFGDAVVAADGTIDRRALGSMVFGQPDELRKLTDIVWPEIRRLADLEIEAQRARRPDGVVVLEAAVMVEAGWQRSLDEVWVVAVEPEVAIERAMARDGLTADEVRARLSAQTSNAERKRHADVVIDNSAGLDELHAQLDRQWERVAGTHGTRTVAAS